MGAVVSWVQDTIESLKEWWYGMEYYVSKKFIDEIGEETIEAIKENRVYLFIQDPSDDEEDNTIRLAQDLQEWVYDRWGREEIVDIFDAKVRSDIEACKSYYALIGDHNWHSHFDQTTLIIILNRGFSHGQIIEIFEAWSNQDQENLYAFFRDYDIPE